MSASPEILDLSILAREYVKNGWALVPIPSGGKFPTAKGWNLKANCVTTLEGCRRIRANVGLAHAYSRTCVLDFDDMAKAGAWLAEHDIDINELWGALDAIKISSGRANRGKLLYRLPAGVAPLLTHQDHGGGIELRCASSNGKTMQDVLPPSIHPDTGRPYVWEYDDMLASWDNPPELPANVLAVWQGLSARLDDARSEQMAYGDGDEAAARALLEDLDPDMTYPQWFKVGAALHHEFGGDHLGLELWDEWSAKGGKYPGWDYLEHKWGTIVRTEGPLATLEVLRAELRNRPATSDEFQVMVDEELAISAPPAPVSSVEDDFADLGPAEESPVSRDLAPVGKKPMFEFQGLADFMRRPLPQWVIKGVLPKAALGVLYGASGSGKSFLALDMAISVARGENWRGARTTQGGVAYVVAEGAGGFTARVRAYCQANNLAPDDIPLHLLAGAPNLMEAKIAAALGAALVRCGPLSVIFVDTYARVMGGGNENEAKDTNTVVGNCELLHQLTGAIVVLVHHSGKDAAKGARGSGALKAAADVELEVVRTKDYRALTVSKMKDADDGVEYHFKLANVTIGMDEDGEDLTSCVVDHIAAVPVHERKGEAKGDIEKAIYAYLMGNIDLGSDTMRTEDLIATVAETMDYDHTTGKKDRRKEMAKRALESLERKKLLVNNGTTVALGQPNA